MARLHVTVAGKSAGCGRVGAPLRLKRPRAALGLALWVLLGTPSETTPFALRSGGTTAAHEQGAPLPLRIHVDAGLEGVAGLVATDTIAWRPFPGIGRLQDIRADTVELWLVREWGPGLPERLRRPEAWVAGVADPERGTIALRSGSNQELLPRLRAVFRHELAHLALHHATGGNSPRWLAEGYAQYASGLWGWEEAWQLRIVFFRRGGAALRNLDLRFRREPPEVRLGYLLSYTVVHELAALAGERGLAAFFARLRHGDSIDQGLRSVYGLTLEQFETRWRRSVLDRYGWLYLVSRATVFWFAVTCLVLFVSLRRARQDRRRLSALRAAEAAEDDARQDGWEQS